MIRTFFRFADTYPWAWTASLGDEWSADLVSRQGLSVFDAQLSAGTAALLDLVVDVVEEPLQFIPGEWPPPRVCLEVGQMRGGVPFVATPSGMGTEPLFAHGGPVVERADHVLGSAAKACCGPS